MEVTPERDREIAKELNDALAADIRRDACLQLSWAVGLFTAALLALLTPWPSAAAPLFLAGLIPLILYFVSRDQYQEVSSRNWARAVPRRTRGRQRHGDQEPGSAATATAPSTPNGPTKTNPTR